jgi:hypothetical protein
MIDAFIAWLIIVVIVCIVAGLIIWVLQQFPLADPFGRIARVAIIVIACLIILLKALPLLHVAV